MPPRSRAKRIDELVGKRTGRSAQVNRAKGAPQRIVNRRRKEMAGAGKEAVSTYLSHGGGKVPAAVRKEHAAWYGGGLNKVSPYSAAKTSHEDIFNKFSGDIQDYNKQVLDQNATRTEYAANVLDQQVDPNNPRSVMVGDQEVKLTPSIDEQFLGGNLQKYVVTPISRSAAVFPNAAYEMLKAGYENKEEGGGYWEQTLEGLKAGAGGLAEGVKATATPWQDTETPIHGWGDIYELSKRRGDNVFADAARLAEEKVPFAEEQFSRVAGGTLDFATHPLGRMVSGVKTGVIGGKLATESAVREFADDFGRRWAADAENQIITGAAKAPGNYRTFPSEQAIADHVYKATTDVIEHGRVQIHAGGSRGRIELLNRRLTAGNVGVQGSQALLESMTSLFSDRVQRLVDGMTGRGPKLSGSALDHWASLNPDFTEFLDDLTSDLIAKGELPSNASRDMLARQLSSQHDDVVRNIEQGVVDRHYSPYIQQAADDMAREFRNSYYNTPGIRIGRDKVIPVKGVGRAFSTVNAKVFGDIGKNFRYNSVFPGSLGLDTTKMRAFGVRATEDFEKLVREKAAPFSKIDGQVMQRAIDNNTIHQLPVEQQSAIQWVMGQYKEMYEAEFVSGVRGRKPNSNSHLTPYDSTYAYVYNKGGETTARKKFKKNRKETIHSNVRAGNGQGAGRFKTGNAKEGGLRPTENIFDALSKRRVKHNRDMIRSKFLNDMVDKYGIVARINPSGKGYAAEMRGLEKVDFSKLPEPMRQALEKTGENAYLPREMAQMIDQFDEITKWTTAQHGRAFRYFAEVMRIIKKGQTLPWPGFHSKNAIGDIFMGMLDGVLPQHYAEVMRKGLASIGGKNAYFKILKENAGLDIGFREIWHKYQTEANSGFASSELGSLDSATARWNVPRRVAGKAEDIAIGVSGFREDAGRFTHYVAAYKQEAKALWRKGERDLAKIENQASSAALWRVNNYKFDYNALTIWEKQAKTLAFPFFTFIRKAAPTLFQALYQDPRWISAWTRYMHQNQLPNGEESASSFDGFRVPEDIRNAGFAFIGGQSDEPTYVSNDLLPTSVFNQVRTRNPHEFFNSILTQTALPLQVAIEQGTGQQTFLDRPIEKDTSFGEYLLGKLPGTREATAWIDSNKTLKEKLISNRLGAGLPIRQLNENQQLYAEREWHDRLIDDPLKTVNTSQDLYYISSPNASDGRAKVYTVKNNMLLEPDGNATVVASFYTAEEAIQYVKKNLPDSYKKVPQTWDVDNQGNPVRREISNG